MEEGAEEEERGGKQGDEAKDLSPAEEPTNNRRAMRPLEAEKRQRQRKRRDTRTKGTGTQRPHRGHRSRSLA